MTATMQQTPWVGRTQAHFPIISFRPMGWCMRVNDSVTNTALSMSTLLTALQFTYLGFLSRSSDTSPSGLPSPETDWA